MDRLDVRVDQHEMIQNNIEQIELSNINVVSLM